MSGRLEIWRIWWYGVFRSAREKRSCNRSEVHDTYPNAWRRSTERHPPGLCGPKRGRRPSWGVLANAGNCASASVLLVLENILRIDKPGKGEHGVLLTFGPGLTIEGAVLRF